MINFFLICLVFIFISPTSFAAQLTPFESETTRELLLFFDEDELFVKSPTRKIKHISLAAENMPVITAKEIEEMNYHTVSEVLNAVPGIQVYFRGPWYGSAQIQGTPLDRAIIKIDGITFNYVSNTAVDLGIIPVQHIARIEIINPARWFEAGIRITF